MSSKIAGSVSPVSVVIALLWLGYAVVAGWTYYDAFDPLKRELVAILGGITVVLVALSLALLRATAQSRGDEHA